MLATSTRNESIPFSSWWEEPVLKLNKEGETVSRRQIILTAADKDGAAHIDAIKPVWYNTLEAGLRLRAIVETADGRRLGIIFQNANLAALRQIGHELLTSEELTALAK
jgi:hypothetical protein